jgi:hypothetical protein
MARASSRTPSSSGKDTDPAAAVVAAAASDDAIAATRALLVHPLDSAQDVLHALLRLQAQEARALRSWAHAVDEGVHEAQAARDLPGLLTAMLKLTARQFSLASSQWAEGWSQWLEGGGQLADQVRSDAAALANQLQPPAAAPLASWSQAQAQAQWT